MFVQEMNVFSEEYDKSRILKEEWEKLNKSEYFFKDLIENFEEKDRFVEAELKNLKVDSM
jgi:hypothetical protein